MHDYFQQASTRPGIRLHKLELMNWGTFDSSNGRVYTVNPNGNTTLLVGENGAGKSTLADSLLTLLVPARIRNYNVAAGAGGGGQSRSRTERTYLRGAFDHGSVEGEKSALRFLRPEGAVYGVMLAVFKNEDVEGKDFTLAQILVINADEKVKKVYAFAKGEKSIAGDLAGFTNFDRLRKQVEDRGFQATESTAQYEKWFFNAAGLRPKAMDIFNQTVAVKDIVSLNEFIRRHMLEKRNWGDEIERILTHFNQLADAHQTLVRTREQLQYLKPIKAAAEAYQSASTDLSGLLKNKEAIHPWFCSRKVELIAPLLLQNEEKLKANRSKQRELERSTEALDAKIGELSAEINRAGGPRLQQLPGLIQAAEVTAGDKRNRSREFLRCVKASGVETEVNDDGPRDENEFSTWRISLQERVNFLKKKIPESEAKKTGLGFQKMQKEREIEELRKEIEALKQRRTALPQVYVLLRRTLCESLGLTENDLPFAAELIAIKSQERDWESSIELVLRSFALSLLVPDRHYHKVSEYINRNRLSGPDGRGMRLVYHRIGHDESFTNQKTPLDELSDQFIDEDSLPGKLDFHPKHSLSPWVKGEVSRHFNYRCCRSVEDFQKFNGDAMTTDRHIKRGKKRHEKDDRRSAADRSNYVLGWDNSAKLKHLLLEAENATAQLKKLEDEIKELERSLSRMRAQQRDADRALETEEFHLIDFLKEEVVLAELNREASDLKSGSRELKDLNEQLSIAKRQKVKNQLDRDDVFRVVTQLEDHIRIATDILDAAKAEIESWEAAGTWTDYEESFASVAELATDYNFSDPLGLEIPERKLTKQVDGDIDMRRDKVDPLRNRLLEAMTKFLRNFAEFSDDLSVSEDFAPDFIALHDKIIKSDLPGFEMRFKERLNDKAAKEIAVLNGKLQEESREIKTNIRLLNDALRTLPYGTGTHMQLVPDDVNDPEILKFRVQLRDCLANATEKTMEAHEERFKEIEKLINDLRDDRYRNRVTDVRRWFDFYAAVIDTETGLEKSRYTDSSGRSGGEKAKLAFTILVAAITYQYQIDPRDNTSDKFHFVVVDEMFAKMADDYSIYALELFKTLKLQLLIVAPLDAKARITEDYVDYYLLVTKDEDTSQSQIFTMSSSKFQELSRSV
ncbi:MAG: ATP-binding protein [Verrucomicrobiales bacterium]|nr:ATP-binding protein [Verrucomicrobiales bacterium]